jgi:hypothetical protein
LSTLNSNRFSHAQHNGEELSPSSNFRIIELSEQIGYNGSISSIDIDLPSTSWNITDIEMNFTDIKLGKEIKTIEEDGRTLKSISWKERLGYGVELNITEPTTLFGVYIKTYYEPRNVSKPVYVQIQGYNIINNTPNNNVLASTEINTSRIPDWYYQKFESAVLLSPGKYYLVINGTSLDSIFDKTIYHWFSNLSSTLNPTLNTAFHNGIKWSNESVGEPFLHRLVQRVDRSFNPEEVNMTLNIDGSLYPISLNGSIKIHQLISPFNTNFHIPILNNNSIELLFNLSFYIKLQNLLVSEGKVLIKESLPNFWTLEPNIQRCYCNYSIQFNYPKDWYNLTVFRDSGGGWEDISYLINIDTLNNSIFISKDHIIEDTNWKITANSPNIQLSLNVPITVFSPSQSIQFSVNAPIYPGNLTFRLFNPIGFLAQSEVTYTIDSIQSEDLLFNYQLSDNPHKGIYKAYVFWHNGTAAGVITQEFEVKIPFAIDLNILIGIIGFLAFLLISSVTTYEVIKRNKRKHAAHRQMIFNKYRDLMNLEYFIIIDKESAISVYEQILTNKSIDGLLVSGFLDAIRSFGIELTGADKHSQTIKLEYHDSKILMSEYKSFRIILIMKETPSQDFLEAIKQLSYDIESKYGTQLENFNGNVTHFKGIKDLLEIHLHTSLKYPLEISTQSIRLNQNELLLTNRAKALMKKKNADFFMVTDLFPVKKGFYTKEAETFLNLIKKKIFRPKIQNLDN